MTQPATVIDKDLSALTRQLESPRSEIIADAMAKIVQRIEPNDPNETDNDSRTYRKKTIDRGCGHSIIKIMSEWSQNENIMYIGCVVLINLTVEDTEFAHTGEETNGIAVVAEMIKNPKFHNIKMLGVAFSVLANYAAKFHNVDYMSELNIEDDICEGMSALRDSELIQEKGSRVLNNLLYWRKYLSVSKDPENPNSVVYNFDCIRGAIKIALAILQHIQWKSDQEDQQLHALETIYENIDKNLIPDDDMHQLDNKMLHDIIGLVLLTMNNNKDEQDIQATGCKIMREIWRFDNVNTKVRAAMDKNNADATLRYAYHHYHIEDAKNFIIQELWNEKAES